MRVFRSLDRGGLERELTTLALGTIGGLAIGALLSRVLPRRRTGTVRTVDDRNAIGRMRPAPLRRLMVDQDELDGLETAVLNAFLEDPILSERGIDVGAISRGIIELSGSVWTTEEASRAVSVAGRVPGVDTVFNRMDVEDLASRRTRRDGPITGFGGSFSHEGGGRVGGMGRRRQGNETDPERADDSQPMRERALAAADRDHAVDEEITGLAYETRGQPEVGKLNFSEDELDNQDPHGKHARVTLDRPPEELNSFARVGQGTKPRTELRLERGDTEVQGESPRDV